MHFTLPSRPGADCALCRCVAVSAGFAIMIITEEIQVHHQLRTASRPCYRNRGKLADSAMPLRVTTAIRAIL